MRTLVIVSGWLWGLAALPVFTDATTELVPWLLLLLICPVIGFVWLIYSAGFPEVFRAPRVRWLWLSVPVICAGGLWLGWGHHGLAARVWLCESALREHAELARQNPEMLSESRQVGLFWVRDAGVDGERVYLTTATGFSDKAGIVYCPAGLSGELGTHTYRHLYGPWWLFHTWF